jgi:hypothetical protein
LGLPKKRLLNLSVSLDTQLGPERKIFLACVEHQPTNWCLLQSLRGPSTTQYRVPIHSVQSYPKHPEHSFCTFSVKGNQTHHTPPPPEDCNNLCPPPWGSASELPSPCRQHSAPGTHPTGHPYPGLPPPTLGSPAFLGSRAGKRAGGQKSGWSIAGSVSGFDSVPPM